MTLKYDLDLESTCQGTKHTYHLTDRTICDDNNSKGSGDMEQT